MPKTPIKLIPQHNITVAVGRYLLGPYASISNFCFSYGLCVCAATVAYILHSVRFHDKETEANEK